MKFGNEVIVCISFLNFPFRTSDRKTAKISATGEANAFSKPYINVFLNATGKWLPGANSFRKYFKPTNV